MAHAETPLSLAYGMEAVISTEIRVSTIRVLRFDHDQNDQLLRSSLDLLEQKREMA